MTSKIKINAIAQWILDKHPAVHSCDEVAKLCQPLAKHFAINHVTYMKLYWSPACNAIVLSSRKDWQEYYYRNAFYLYTDDLPNMERGGWYFADDYPKKFSTPLSSNLVGAAQEELFDMCHLTIFVKHSVGMTEFWTFTTSKSHINFKQTVIANEAVFKKFMSYFKDQGRAILKSAKKMLIPLRKLAENRNVTFTEQISSVKNLLEELEPKRYYLEGVFEDIYLTQSEMKCLQLLAQNLNYTQIADRLDISYNTVREHIDKVRNKLDCPSKKALLETIKEHKLLQHTHCQAAHHNDRLTDAEHKEIIDHITRLVKYRD